MDVRSLFQGIIEKDKDLTEALSVVTPFTKGNVWLVGEYLYRNLAHHLYGTPGQYYDISLLAEQALPGVPQTGWRRDDNRFIRDEQREHTCGFHCIKTERRHDYSDDRIVVQERHVQVYSLQDKHTTIEQFLASSLYTVESLAYDLQKKELVGDAGIAAIATRTIGIYNVKKALKPGKEKMLVELQQEANWLKFKVVLPSCMCDPCMQYMSVEHEVRHG